MIIKREPWAISEFGRAVRFSFDGYLSRRNDLRAGLPVYASPVVVVKNLLRPWFVMRRRIEGVEWEVELWGEGWSKGVVRAWVKGRSLVICRS